MAPSIFKADQAIGLGTPNGASAVLGEAGMSGLPRGGPSSWLSIRELHAARTDDVQPRWYAPISRWSR
jgi:hypothetical protein